MRFQILTLFPDMFNDFKDTSIIGRAAKNGIISIETHNIRDYTLDKHKKVDDYPYGGGPGMVMQCQPIYDAYKACVDDENALFIYTSPRGEPFTSHMAEEFAIRDNIVILCGHYEGVDQRVLDLLDAREVSIGDYVLTGGELASMVIIDVVSRFVPGVLGKDESSNEESFSSGLLEYSQYTRPEEFMERRVPDVLLSGHHKNIEKWRLDNSMDITSKNRPDLYEKYLEEVSKHES